MDGITKFGILLATAFFIYLRTQDKDFKLRRKQYNIAISKGNIESDFKSIERLECAIKGIDEEIIELPSKSESLLSDARIESRKNLFNYLCSMPLMLLVFLHTKLLFKSASNIGSSLRESMYYLPMPDGGLTIKNESNLSVLQTLNDFIHDLPNYYLSFQWYDILGFIVILVISAYGVLELIREIILLSKKSKSEYEASTISNLVTTKEEYKKMIADYKNNIEEERTRIKKAKNELKLLEKS